MPSTEFVTRHPQTPPARAPSKPEPSGGDIPAEDWDLLLDAVTARLRTHTTVPRAVMLDCAAALEQLHAALRHSVTAASMPSTTAPLSMPSPGPPPRAPVADPGR